MHLFSHVNFCAVQIIKNLLNTLSVLSTNCHCYISFFIIKYMIILVIAFSLAHIYQVCAQLNNYYLGVCMCIHK